MITHRQLDPGDPATIDQLMTVVADEGAAAFDGVAGRPGLLRFAQSALTVYRHRDSDTDGVTMIHDRGAPAERAGNLGFGHRQLSLHTESSARQHPPALMVLYCASAASAGGACQLLDGAELVRELAQHDPELLALLCAPRSVLFGGAAGHLGSVLTVADTRMSIRLRLDELAQFSPVLAHRLPDLRKVLTDLMITIRLRPGSGYALSNTRWLHGRSAFTGDRIMYRLLGEPHDRFSISAGFPSPVPAARVS
ncbi:TauD/TfdA family dioxygenase [Dactylosporangium cerinum]|uniref:TauD/TfdA family dioxygenase n=1 Tax=Dactylosporangium cerinum TaxID=1434730 RepID=A0ABV9WCZ0_9ACTN